MPWRTSASTTPTSRTCTSRTARRNQGDNVPWGTGDTPIREVLQLLKQNKWPIARYLEYEYEGAGTPVEEVKAMRRLRAVRRWREAVFRLQPRHAPDRDGPGGPRVRRGAPHRRGAASRASSMSWRSRRAPDRSARAKADALGVPKAYGSYEALAADPDVHVVHNTTPNHLHVPVHHGGAGASESTSCRTSRSR